MSHRNEETAVVVKSVAGIVGVTLMVIVLINYAANLRTKPSLTANNHPPALSTAAADPTEGIGVIATGASLVANDTAPEPSVKATDFTANDGFIAANATLSPFDTDQPAVGKLNRDLLDAIQHAATDAATDGIEIRINSAWRSARYQQYLLDEAVIEYGNEREARKWVDTPEQSSHVAGNAVDIAPTDADDWLLRYGNRYGLCQMYANEIWHFELAVQPGAHCPRPKTDASGG